MAVYITQEPSEKMNILPAQEYGELVVLLGPKQLILSSDSAIHELKSKLLMFNDRDYILPIGDPAIIGLAATIAALNNEGRVKYLKWDRQEHRYYSLSTSVGKK